MRQKDAMTILLTGRGERNFGALIKRMVASKKLDFDMVCLKQQVGPKGQRFSSTMHYKQSLLEDLIYTYKEAEEIRVYEDRPKQYDTHSFTSKNSIDRISVLRAFENSSKRSTGLCFPIRILPSANLSPQMSYKSQT